MIVQHAWRSINLNSLFIKIKNYFKNRSSFHFLFPVKKKSKISPIVRFDYRFRLTLFNLLLLTGIIFVCWGHSGMTFHNQPNNLLITPRIASANKSILHDISEPLGARINVHRLKKSLQNRVLSYKDSTALWIANAGLNNLPSVEQTEQGIKPPPKLVASFDGLGEDFVGTQGTALLRNPSDNSLAVGPDHIVQIVNSRMSIFTKKGSRFKKTGRVLYGPVETNNVFKDFGDAAANNNGDAVVRYDQLADRWLIVMPIFRRLPLKANEPIAGKSGEPASLSQVGVAGQPGAARQLYQPPHPSPQEDSIRRELSMKAWGKRKEERAAHLTPKVEAGSYAMCYAISTSSDPLGSYYRYEFIRPLFPDYPRPAVWPDGYYIPTSTGDEVVQKQAFVADREKMLKGEDATEQGIIIDDVNFLNNADLDGKQLPPVGAPNIVMATGGSQLKKITEDDGIYYWKFHVDWKDPSKTKLAGPQKIKVAPYHYLCDGQLSNCVPQPGSDQRLDAQGDKIMARLVYRRMGNRESIVAVHSINSTSGGGGIRWYEFRLDKQGNPTLYQQGTYAPDDLYRWMPSPAIDAAGNIGIGYSFGGATHFPGQRFAGRLSNDPPGILSMHEAVLAEGGAAQNNTLRWMDYSQTAINPSDDRTIWYVGDYLKKGATNYSTRIGAFQIKEGKTTKYSSKSPKRSH